jgi:hypothetical protein
MLLFALIVVLAAFLAAAVWWLQRQNRQTLRDSIDRSSELPPLAAFELPEFLRPATPTGPAAPEFTLTPPEPKPVRTDPAAHGNIWQDQVKHLRETGNLEAGLALCQQHFPKSQAFQQAAILLRLQMKQVLERRQDIAPLLVELYRYAALADLFRSTAPLRPANPLQAFRAVVAVEFPYQQLGHHELKLLSKSDSKLLEQRWGQPARHQHAEAVVTQWESLCH